MSWKPASRLCRWGFHRWVEVDAVYGVWGLVDQCARCESWRVSNVMAEAIRIYPPHVGRIIHHQREDVTDAIRD